MGYVATIKRVSNGAIFEVPQDLPWEEHSQCWWEEGNFACDCNRAMQVGDKDESCGDSRYLVKITLPDGSVPYNEIDEKEEHVSIVIPSEKIPRDAKAVKEEMDRLTGRTWCFTHSQPLPCADCAHAAKNVKEGDWGVY